LQFARLETLPVTVTFHCVRLFESRVRLWSLIDVVDVELTNLATWILSRLNMG